MNIISLLNLIMIIVIIIVLFKINNDINKIKVVHDEKEENIDLTLNKVYNNQLYFNDILNEIIDIMNDSTTEKEKNMLLEYLNEQLTNYKNSRNINDSESYINGPGPLIEFYEDEDNSQIDLKDKLKKISDLIDDNKEKQEDLKKLLSELNIDEIYNKYNNIDNLVKDIMKKIEENIIIGDGDLKLMHDISNIRFCTKKDGIEVCKKIKNDSIETLPSTSSSSISKSK